MTGTIGYVGASEKTSDFVDQLDNVDTIEANAGKEPIESHLLSDSDVRHLVWKQDKRIIPLCAGIYLLCYLDRSNIGNAKVLNSSTHNDLLSETGMSTYQYTIALMVFLVAYAY